MRKVILFGAGGLSENLRAIVDGKYDVVGYLDEFESGSHKGVDIIGKSVDDVPEYEKYAYIVSIGEVKDKKRIFLQLEEKGVDIFNAVSDRAIISKDAVIGKGNHIGPGVVIAPGVKIGDNNFISSGAIVEHDSVVGNHCRIASHATINGETIVEDEVYIGAGSVINGDMTIGKGATIGSGAVVTKSVSAHVTVVGVPARPMKKKPGGATNGEAR